MKKFSWFAILAVLIALLIFYYVNRPAQGVAAQTPEYEMLLSDLFDEIEKNEPEAFTKYSDKVIQITGNYFSMSGEGKTILILEDEQGRKANCQIDSKIEEAPAKGVPMKLKGIFTGYDDMFGEVQLNKCHIE